MKKRQCSILVCFAVAMLLGFPAASMALKAGPDAYGYYYFDSREATGPEYQWEGLAGVLDADSYDLSADEMGPARSIGFSFEFYGKTYTQVYISSEGFLTFTETRNEGCCNGDTLPNPNGRIKNVIAGLWDDLNPGG